MSIISSESPEGLEMPAWASTIKEQDGTPVFRSSNITCGTATSHIDQNADEDEPYIYISGADGTEGGGDVQMMKDVACALVVAISRAENRSVADLLSGLSNTLHAADEAVQS